MVWEAEEALPEEKLPEESLAVGGWFGNLIWFSILSFSVKESYNDCKITQLNQLIEIFRTYKCVLKCIERLLNVNKGGFKCNYI